MNKKINVTIWNEFRHEKNDENVKVLYPSGLHAAIRDGIACDDFNIRLACLDDPDQGLPEDMLNDTDVLLWWGHCHHDEVEQKLVDRIVDRVRRQGMGFIALHSGHHSRPFRALLGATGDLSWGDDQPEIVWNIMPSHPIAAGIPEHFVLPVEEMYGEPFFIPQPDELVFTSWFKHGNIFRSGCCFYRGIGRIFYLQPGHESCRSYYDKNILRIISNAIRWAAPTGTEVRDNGAPHQKEQLDRLYNL